MRSAARPVAVLAVLAVATTAAVSLAGAPSREPITEPATLTFKADSVSLREEDVSPDGFSIGDRDVRTSRLIAGGEEIGRMASVCTATGNRPNEVFCNATFKFDEGQVAVQILYRRSVFLGGGATNVAIVGGTGNYRNVGGQGEMTRVNRVRTRWVLELTP